MTVWSRLYEEHAIRESLSSAIREIKRNQEESESLYLLRDGTCGRCQAREPNEILRDQGLKRKNQHRQDYEREQKPAFHPKILPKSAELAKSSGRCTEPVIHRLYTSRSVHSENVSDGVQSAVGADAVSNQQFLARQEVYRAKKKNHDGIRHRLAYKDCSFTPRISLKSQILSSRACGGESAREFVHRLAINDVVKRRQREKAKSIEEHRRCRFSPQIDPLSDALAVCLRAEASEPVHLRLYKNQTKSHSTESCASIGELAPTPRVKRMTAYSHIRSHYDMRNPSETLASLDRERRERELKRELVRDQEAIRELEECTFQPNLEKRKTKVFPSASTCSSAVLIPGIDKFRTLRQRAAETPSRVERPRSASSLLTIPTPFVFRSRSHASLYSSN